MGYTKEVRKEASRLHKNGFSYKEISEKLGVAKSTLSTWIGSSPRTPSDKKKQKTHLDRIRPLAARAKSEKRQRWVEASHLAGKKEAKRIIFSKPAVKSMLAMLYWAEGSKYEGVAGLKFVNTDPSLLSLYMRLLRMAYPIDESRLRARIHMHYYHKSKELLKFWSSTLDIPESQFNKMYVKKRSRQKRFRKNFMGICFVNYYDSTIREELLSLGRSIEKELPKQCLLS